MKLVRIVSKKHPKGVYGVVNADGIEVVRGGLLDGAAKTGEVVRQSDIVRYLPPLAPPNIIAFGVNYIDHAAECGAQKPERPLMFMKPLTSVVGHGDAILLPRMAPEGVDYEAELCAIIGRTAKNVAVEEALAYVFGYTCNNDVSARDCQGADVQWARGKSFDTFCPIGPCVVTDFDPDTTRVRMRLNGRLMQDQPTSDMIFNTAELISFASKCMTLLPGTLILTGTPGGVGFKQNPPVFLRAGDVCEVEIDGIGTLQNTVAAE